ncbi:MAG: hydantoinase/oxoprolinase family protein [Spongiibacteraceae bacterium]
MQTQTSDYFLGVDTGGTFTDFVLYSNGEIRSHKCLSTPAQPEQAILQGIRFLGLEQAIRDGRLSVIHGSTVATNAALEGNGVRTAYISNRGFGDVLSIGRQTRAELYQLQPDIPIAPVAKELCLETGGRIGADGLLIEPLDATDLHRLKQQLEELQPEAVAINLLFSFVDDQYEKAIEAIVPPQMFVSRSSKILPEYKEYERGIACWLNAWLGPKVASYLQQLRSELGSTPLAVMQSSGGTTDAENASQRAVNLLLSGPAGGLAAAKHLCDQAPQRKLITFDMGGTSSDVALINGDIALTSEGKIGPYPVAVPMVDMHTIGAGGGSIAFIDDGGLLRVGPRSAGATPGPACYNMGGTDATVTDANLVLGRLPRSTQLGGSLLLNVAAAQRAIATLAKQLDLSVEDTAAGIIDIANEHMVRALRVISVQRGHDPAEFQLCCFGGAGGLHVCALAEALHCRQVIVPNYSGVFSALGMLLAPSERQLSRTVNLPLSAELNPQITAQFAKLAHTGKAQLFAESIADSDISCRYSVDLCYWGQSYTLNLPWQENFSALSEAFHVAHQQRYGHQLDITVQLVNIRCSLRAPAKVQRLPTLGTNAPAVAAEHVTVAGSNQRVPRFIRKQLAAGQHIKGPALISEDLASSWLPPAWSLIVGKHGELLLTWNSSVDDSTDKLSYS